MSFYKVESTYRLISNSGSKNKKTYKYFCSSHDNMNIRFEHELAMRASSIKVKEISQSEYVRGTR